MKNKIIALVLTAVTFISSLVTPVYAAEDVPLTLDDGSVLYAPTLATDSYFVVNLYQWHGITVDDFEFQIFEFSDISEVYEGASVKYTLWESGVHNSLDAALTSEEWDSKEEEDILVIDSLTGSYNRIVFSNFDYKDDTGAVLHYANNGSTPPDTPVVGPDITVRPVRSYGGLLPDVSEATAELPFDNWLVYRKKTSEYGYQYWLLFFSDDYEFVMDKMDYTADEVRGNHPQIILKAASISRYRLKGEQSFGDYNDITDASLEAAIDARWGHDSTESGEVNLFFPLNGKELNTIDKWQNFLCDMFIASSVAVSVEGSSGYTYEDENGATVNYTLASYAWSPTYYSEGGGEEDTEQVGWLRKIYYAIKDGFTAVLDKLDNLGTAVDPDDPALDEPDIGADEEGNGGFSLKSIFKIVGDFIMKFIGGIFGLIGNMVGDLVGHMGDFFDLIKDSTSDLFGFFNRDETEGGMFSSVLSFFDYMHQLWLCVPTPVRFAVNGVFTLFVFIAMLKMFHL